jgi:hypothetical protein
VRLRIDGEIVEIDPAEAGEEREAHIDVVVDRG